MHSGIVNKNENLKPFWDTYRIKASTYGHCLHRSIISTLHSEYPQYTSYVIKDLLSDVVDEVISNMNIYLILFDDMSIDSPLNEMYDYVVNRSYDTYFCDIVPAIAANVL